MFEDSFDASVRRDRQSFAEAQAGGLKISNRDLDTGNTVRPGEYALTDRTYDALLGKLAKKNFDGVTPELREDIQTYYCRMKTPYPHAIGAHVTALAASARTGQHPHT